MRFIGDIHGNVSVWRMLIGEAEESIQVGDFGMGFLPSVDPPALDGVDWEKHRFIRGNHDDPALCRAHPGWIEDGSYDAARDIFFVGGAWSIDRAWRVEGRNWWPDEQLSEDALDRARAHYIACRPRIMVTHDCPHSVAKALFTGLSLIDDIHPTATSLALDEMFEAHQPEVWIFGHWHLHRRETIRGTRFICAEINQAIDIDLEHPHDKHPDLPFPRPRGARNPARPAIRPRKRGRDAA